MVEHAMFTLYYIAFCAGTKKLQQRGHRPGTSCSQKSCQSGWPREFVELNPNPLLLKIYFRLSRFQSLLLLIHFRYDPNTCSHYTKVWHRTYPICGAPLSRLTWRGELNPNPKRVFFSAWSNGLRTGWNLAQHHGRKIEHLKSFVH